MTQAVEDRVRFVPDRAALGVVLIAALGALPLALSSPFLTPVLLLPLVGLVWLLRARVTATPAGLEVCNGGRTHRYAWADVDRFDLPHRGPVVLHPVAGRPIRLTALPRRQVRRLTAMGSAT